MGINLWLGIFIGSIVGYIVGILADRYLLPCGDVLLQAFVNKKNLTATEIQRDITVVEKDIRDIRMSMQPSETNVIGYHFEPNEESYEEDCEDECCNKQIGFRRDKTNDI